MFEYVRWCSCVEDLALGSCFNVSLRIRRYSLRNRSNIACFLGVKSTVLSTTHFLKVSPILKLFNSYLNVVTKCEIPQFLPPINGVGFLGGF